jgi:hypothetical protein
MFDNQCSRLMMLFLSAILGMIIVSLILIFFLFLGCPYEFVKCYLEKKYKNLADDINFNDKKEEEEEEENDECTLGKVLICILLSAIGVLFQPLYLIFYIFWAIMECYRHFGCFIFVVAHN